MVALVVGVAGLWGAKMHMTVQGFKAMGIQKQTISTVQVGEQPWRQTLTAIGSLRAVRGADLSNEVAGIVEGIHF